MIRVVLPFHLKRLAKLEGEATVEVVGEATQRAILDALEAQYPVLKGTIRDRETARRRAMVRFYACGEDHSDDSPDDVLPAAVAEGKEPYMVVGAIAGG